MRGLRSTLVLLVLAAGLGAYLYFVESKKPVVDENAKKKVFSSEAAKIDELQITLPSGDATRQTKTANGWTIVKPAELPADQNSASDVASTLASLEEDRVVDDNATDLKAYGLAEPRIDISFKVAGEKEEQRLLVGDQNPTGNGLYAKLPGDNRVFLIASSLESSLNRSTFDLRDKTILRFQEEDVQSIDLTSGNQTIRVEKTGDNWKIVRPVVAPADYVSVSGIVGQLRSAQMMTLKDNPDDIKDLKQYGLDKPQAVATIGLGAQSVTVELGSPADSTSLWARDPSRPVIFSVSSGLADELKKTPFDLRRKEIFEFRPFNATRFEIVRGNQTRAFERVKGTGENATDTWKQVAPAAKGLDTAAVEAALLEFSNLRAEAAIDTVGPTTGLNSPVATIAVTFDDGKKEERVTIGRLGEDVFAARQDQPGALKVEMGTYDAAIKKLDSIQ